MTNKIQLSLATGALALAVGLLPAGPALAHSEQGVDGSANVGLETGVNLGDDNEIKLDASSTLRTSNQDDLEVNDDSNNNHGSDAEASSSPKHTRSATTTVQHEGSENNNNNGDNEDIDVDHDSALHASSTVTTAVEVKNRGQLRSFLNHLIKGDDRVDDVHVSSTTIETHYQMPAKFLWAIPTTLPAEVVVNADGSVTVSYPWYSFLFAKNGKDLRSQIMTTATSTTTATTTVSASVQAHLLNALFSALKESK